MSQSVLDIILRTKKEGKADQETKTGLEGLKGTMKSFAPVIGVAGVAVGALAGALKYSVGQAAEAELATAQLEAVLKSTGGAAGLTKDELEGMADSLSKMSGVEDDLILKNEAVMLTFTKIGKDVFPQAMEAALNMSAVMGTDLQGSVVQVGKALQDPILGITALRRVGVNFSEDQKDVIQALIDTGKQAEAQAMILGELEVEFGGAAKAAGDTYVGAMNKADIAVGNLAETVGEGLLPVLTDTINVFTEAATGLNEYMSEALALEQVEEDLRAAYEANIITVGEYQSLVSDYSQGVADLNRITEIMADTELLLRDDRRESIAALRDQRIATDELAGTQDNYTGIMNLAEDALKEFNIAEATRLALVQAIDLATGELTEAEIDQKEAVGYLTQMLALGKLTMEDYLFYINELASGAMEAGTLIKRVGDNIALLPDGKTIDIIVKYTQKGKAPFGPEPGPGVPLPPGGDLEPGLVPGGGGQMGGQVWPWQAVRWQEPAAGSEIMITNRQGYILNMRQAQEALAGAQQPVTNYNFYLSANYADSQSEASLIDDVRMLMALYGS